MPSINQHTQMHIERKRETKLVERWRRGTAITGDGRDAQGKHRGMRAPPHTLLSHTLLKYTIANTSTLTYLYIYIYTNTHARA